MAALPLGLLLDRRFGQLPALTTQCGAADTLLGSLEWHWACMPATCLLMVFAAPACVCLKSMANVWRGSPQFARRTEGLAALCCHFVMLAGMASALLAGPSLAALVGRTWTSGAEIAAMAFGMLFGGAADFLVRTEIRKQLGRTRLGENGGTRFRQASVSRA
jgi:hypothetical protein